MFGMIEFKDPNGNPEGLNLERILPFCFPEYPAKLIVSLTPLFVSSRNGVLR